MNKKLKLFLLLLVVVFNFNFIFSETSNDFKIGNEFIHFDLNDKDFTLIESEENDTNLIDTEIKHYNFGGVESQRRGTLDRRCLTGDSCILTFSSGNLQANWNFDNTDKFFNFKPSGEENKKEYEKILRANLYMRVNLIYEFYNNNNEIFETFTSLVYIDDTGISEEEIKGIELPLSKEQYDFVNVSV